MTGAPARRGGALSRRAGTLARRGWLALALLPACTTQRWPEPIPWHGDGAAPEADTTPAGPLEVLVMRHADPVKVRPSGSMASYPLRFYDKQERMKSGGFVITGSGSRAEIYWPGKGASAVMIGESVSRVGEPSRGEPELNVLVLERLRLALAPGMAVELMGSARITGDPDLATTEPIAIARRSAEVARIHNESGGRVRVEFRGERFELGPGQSIELPLLGVRPRTPSALDELARTEWSLTTAGPCLATADGASVRVRAEGDARVVAPGVDALLASGDELRVAGLALRPAPPEPLPPPPPKLESVPTPPSDPAQPEPTDPSVPTVEPPPAPTPESPPVPTPEPEPKPDTDTPPVDEPQPKAGPAADPSGGS